MLEVDLYPTYCCFSRNPRQVKNISFNDLYMKPESSYKEFIKTSQTSQTFFFFVQNR